MDNVICKAAGERIFKIRKLRGYPRVKLAKEIGISSKFLYEIEQGKKRFSAETLYCLAKVLEVSCDYIMFGNTDKEIKQDGVTEVIALFDEEQRKKLISILKLVYEMMNG